MKKQLYELVKLLIFLVAFVAVCNGCKEHNTKDTTENFCSYLNAENIDKSLVIANQFIKELSVEMDYEQQLQELMTWLKSSQCINVAAVFKTQTQSMIEVYFSFDEGGTTKRFIMGISLEKQMKIVGHHEYNQNIGDFISETEWCQST